MPSQFYIASLLERGVRTLLYSGTYDWQCNWAATRLWLEKLEWTGSAQYKANAWRDWTVDGHKAGEVKTAGPLTFATVRGAGHMISRFRRLSGIEGPRALTLASFAVNTSRTTSPWRRRRWSPSGWRSASYNKATAPRRLRVGSWRTPRAFLGVLSGSHRGKLGISDEAYRDGHPRRKECICNDHRAFRESRAILRTPFARKHFQGPGTQLSFLVQEHLPEAATQFCQAGTLPEKVRFGRICGDFGRS